MAGPRSKIGAPVAMALPAVVVVAGYPAFRRAFGFPVSLIWTRAPGGGLWLTYLIRARAFSGHGDERKGDRRWL